MLQFTEPSLMVYINHRKTSSLPCPCNWASCQLVAVLWRTRYTWRAYERNSNTRGKWRSVHLLIWRQDTAIIIKLWSISITNLLQLVRTSHCTATKFVEKDESNIGVKPAVSLLVRFVRGRKAGLRNRRQCEGARVVCKNAIDGVLLMVRVQVLGTGGVQSGGRGGTELRVRGDSDNNGVYALRTSWRWITPRTHTLFQEFHNKSKLTDNCTPTF